MILSEGESERLKQITFFERQLLEQGYLSIAGVDEAGRGPLAGPVVAAACILPPGELFPGINDSKALSVSKRNELYQKLISHPKVVCSCEMVFPEIIDQINILQASFLAMRKAIEALAVLPDYVLIDGKDLLSISISQKALIQGDKKSISIAAASILAKVERDRYMVEVAHTRYPEYGFSIHKGYGTAKHLQALLKLGPSPLHRVSFAPVRKLISYGVDPVQDETDQKEKFPPIQTENKVYSSKEKK